MVPIYGLALTLATMALLRLRSNRARRTHARRLRLAGAAVLVAWLTIGAVLPSMFPVFDFQPLTGPYRIGTAVYQLEHAPRNRDLVIQAWYPVTGAARGPLAHITTHPALLEDVYASFTGLPRPLFDHLRLIKTHAVINAPVAGGARLPVLLFSHGPLAANRSQSIFQMEALASAGFVVIAIDHTGYASTTIFPDGHAVAPGPEAAWPVFVDARSTAMLQTWVADVRFVLDRLEALDAHDAASLLTGRLDLNRVGYLGASFGGSVVVQALLDEPRIKAGVAEDGKPYFSDATPGDLRRPLMYMQSAAPYIASSDAQLARWGLTKAAFRRAEQDHYSRQMQLFGRAVSPIYNVYIRRTNHVTFSDLGLIIRIPDSSLTDIRRAHAIINAYTIAFFNRYLNGAPSALVDGVTPSPYEDVTVASRNVAGLNRLARNQP
jgi:predicted dienelactone hydrolase